MKFFTRKNNECVTLKHGEAIAVTTRKGLVKVSDLNALQDIRETLAGFIGQTDNDEIKQAINKAFAIICDCDKAVNFTNRTAPSPFD